MIYDLRTSRVTAAFRSGLHVRTEALLLTSNLVYSISVQPDCVVVWRMEVSSSSTAGYNKYMSDEFPADDHQLSDTDYYYDETVDYGDEQVFLCSDRARGPVVHALHTL